MFVNNNFNKFHSKFTILLIILKKFQLHYRNQERRFYTIMVRKHLKN